MGYNLIDGYYECWNDYAQRIIATCYKEKPIYKIVVRSVNPSPVYTVDFDLIDGSGRILQKSYSQPGLYLVWDDIPKKTNCLYSGGTTWSVKTRFHRFLKERFAVSRPDENHPGGRKAREFEISTENLYVQFIRSRDLPKMKDPKIANPKNETVELIVDEYIAYYLKARFNERIRY
jgi:hypothetical protein